MAASRSPFLLHLTEIPYFFLPQVEFFKHRFIIKDAADCVLAYMEHLGIDQFPEETVESLRDLQMKKAATAKKWRRLIERLAFLKMI